MTYVYKLYEHTPTVSEYYTFVETPTVGTKPGVTWTSNGTNYRGIAFKPLDSALRVVTVSVIVQVETKDLFGSSKWVNEREFKFVVDDLRIRRLSDMAVFIPEECPEAYNEDGSLKDTYRTNYQYCVETYCLGLHTPVVSMYELIQINIQDKIETLLAE